MRTHWILPLVVACLGCPPQRTETPTSGTLTVHVTESLAVLIQNEADEFQRLYPDASITIVPASTRDAIVHLLNDSITCIIVDRQFNEEERQVTAKYNITYVETKIAQDALAVIVNKKNPIQNISLNSLEHILTGKIRQWRSVPGTRWTGRIDLVLTERNSGAYELLVAHFFRLKEQPPVSITVANQYEAFKAVAEGERAIGFISLATLQDTLSRPDVLQFREATRVLAVARNDTSRAFHKPHQAYVYQELYPLHYPIYLYTTAGYASLASGFSAFITSIHGQKIIQNAGLVPATMPVRLVQTTQEPISR
jgi:phosphate transport system substrate-binding protein